MNISEASAVITGGASGLGEATARELSSAGTNVSIFDLDQVNGEKVAHDVGGIFCAVDVTNEASVKTALEKTKAAHGCPRILFNCAGIAPFGKTVGRNGALGLEAFRKVIEVNLIGTFNCVRLVGALMTELDPLEDGERGVIVNTASVAAFDGQVGQVAYAASKAGVAGMTLPLARDFMDHGIRVCAIAPGMFETPMMEGFSDDIIQSLEKTIPFPKRLGRPQEYARLGRHICENIMLNGETIRLDAALRMAPR